MVLAYTIIGLVAYGFGIYFLGKALGYNKGK